MINLNDHAIRKEFVDIIKSSIVGGVVLENDSEPNGAVEMSLHPYDVEVHLSEPFFCRYLGQKLADKFLNEFVRPHLLDDDGFYITTRLTSNYYPDRFAIRMEGKVHKVKAEPMVIKYVTSLDRIPPNYHSCTYCGGYTTNDARGHCAGCGGPRDDHYLEDLEAGSW